MNLGAQSAVLLVYASQYALPAAIVIGTAAGLITKYMLDKWWIFDDRDRGLATQARQFTLYTVTGLITTALFWAMEFAANALTPDGRWRFEGAALGLAIGYIAKYHLDRTFVFRATKG